jgi:hypothetical protein
MSPLKPISVPRVHEVTSSRSVEDTRLEREMLKRRQLSREITQRYGYGTQESKEAWRNQVRASRSF